MRTQILGLERAHMQGGKAFYGSFGELMSFPTVHFEASDMTAIVAVKTAWGVLIAADGRMRVDEESRATASSGVLARETENAQKIFSELYTLQTHKIGGFRRNPIAICKPAPNWGNNILDKIAAVPYY